MHKQRIWTASISAFGLLTLFLPWITVMGLIGISGTEVGQGWLVAVVFGIAIAISLTGTRALALDAGRRGVLAILGLAGAGFGVWKWIEIRKGTIDIGGEIGREMKQQGMGEGGGELGREMGRGFSKMFGENLFEMSFGVYALIAAGIALVIAAAINKRA